MEGALRGTRIETVAIATCDAWPEPGAGLLPLVQAFQGRGLRVICRPWQSDEDRDFATAGLILPLCAWDYAQAPGAFRDWIARIAAAGGRFANAPGLMLWNMDKGYLRDLARAGVAVPPTVLLEGYGAATLRHRMAAEGWRTAVLKPAIGQSGNGVTLIRADDPADIPPSAARHVLQPYLPAIREAGELTMVFVAGRFSHAVLRRPAAGEWRANSRYGVVLEPAVAPPAALAEARLALAALPGTPAYARIDGLVGEAGFTVTEVELIEPALFLHLCPERAGMVADDLLTA